MWFLTTGRYMVGIWPTLSKGYSVHAGVVFGWAAEVPWRTLFFYCYWPESYKVLCTLGRHRTAYDFQDWTTRISSQLFWRHCIGAAVRLVLSVKCDDTTCHRLIHMDASETRWRISKSISLSRVTSLNVLNTREPVRWSLLSRSHSSLPAIELEWRS